MQKDLKSPSKNLFTGKKSDNLVIGAVNIRWNHIGGMKSLMGISVMELSQLKEEKDIARLLYT